MADVTARLSLVDEMSDKFAQIAESGQSAVDSLESMDSFTFSGLDSAAEGVVSSVDGIATSVEQSSSSMEHWTDAVGNYDTKVLEAVYSTEELVDMGLKSADAMEDLKEMTDRCATSQENLVNAVEASVDIHDDLNTALEKASDLMEQVAQSDEVSIDTKERLTAAYAEAQDAMEELENAQQEAADAQAYYDSVIETHTENLGELESAAERVQLAAEDLEEANQRAADATQELSDASSSAADEMDNAGGSAEDFGNTAKDSINSLADVLIAAGIVKLVKEIADAFLDCADAAAEFETSIAKVETIADTSSVSIETIRDDIVSLSNETGQSVNDLSESVYQAISASVATEDAVEFTAAANKLAVGGFTDTTTAVDVLTTAINAYGLEADKATDISDMLVATQNLGKTTVDELSGSIGKVIPLASAYNVDMANLTTSYAEMTKSGITTAESGTYLRSMLQELGDTSSNVSDILVEKTGSSFSELMDQGYSLGDVLNVLGESVDGNATAFSNLWSNQRAGIGALSLYNSGAEEFNSTLEEMENSTGATAQAYETMADTTEHAKDKMVNAADNLKIAFGENLNGALEPLYEIIGNILTKFTEFVEEHPKIVTAVTVITTVFVALVAGIAAVSAVTSAASAAMGALGGAMSAALGPVTAVVAAIAAVAAIVAVVKSNYDDAYDGVYSVTAATQQQYDELDRLKEEYERVCETSGADTEEAYRLKYQIDDLTASIEENGQSVEEWCDDLESIVEGWQNIQDTFNDTMDAINGEEVNNMALIQKLDDLATSTDQTAGSQEAMQKIIDELNGSIDGLNLTYDDLIDNQEAVIQSVRDAASAQAEQERINAMWDEYVEIIGAIPEAQQKVEDAEAKLAAEQDRYNEKLDAYNEKFGWTEYDTSGISSWISHNSQLYAELQASTDAWNDAQEAYDDANGAIDEMIARQAELEEALGITESATEDLGDTTMTEAEAIEDAYNQLNGTVEELQAAYDEAYEAALESFQGQFGLFDEAEANMESTVDAAQAALDSQLAYWETYNANIETLKGTSADDLGITQESYEALMSYVQDGSEEAAGLAQSMVDAIDSGNEEAITSLANTLEEVQSQQEAAAQSTAEWQTDFTAQMQQYAADMATIVASDLELSDEAAASASATLEAYAAAITSSGASAVSAAQSIASQVSAALSSANATINVSTSGAGYATGTTNSVSNFIAGEQGPELVVAAHAEGTLQGEDFYMAGENGPELIIGEPGSTVFPTSETDRLISALNGQQAVNVTASLNGDSGQQGASERKITIEINGSGEMTFSGGNMDEDAILELLEDNVKPILMQIIRQEIMEEGDRTYVY